MDSLQTGATRSVIAAAVLPSLALALLMVIAGAILIDLLSELGLSHFSISSPLWLLDWFCFAGGRRILGWLHNREMSQVCDEPAIAVPRA